MIDMAGGMFTSLTGEWTTPQELYDQLNSEFNFTLDPCCNELNAKCPKMFTKKDDGLKQSWAEERVFMNPPYGRQIGYWVRKAYLEAVEGALVVCLIPSRTDTIWWHEYAMKGEIKFIKGRLKFGGHKDSAPFPSAIVIFRPGVINARP